MKCKITNARLLVATYGKPFTPNTSPPLQVLAKNLDDSAKLQSAMDQLIGGWTSAEVPDFSAGMKLARVEVGNALTATLGPCTINSIDADYMPIYDKYGNWIGHDIVGWIFVNGSSLIKEMPDGAGGKIGLVGCVFLSIGAA